MGVTLVAILSAALLIPGIIASQTFYWAGRLREVDVQTPPLSSASGIAMTGGFAIASHFVYSLALLGLANYPCNTGLPLANPYVFLTDGQPGQPVGLASLTMMLLGFAWLSATGALIGFASGRILLLRDDKRLFYGPLAHVIVQAFGAERFIIAYVLTKIDTDHGILGYRGTVDSLQRDEHGYPIKLTLTDVAPFYLAASKAGPERVDLSQQIDWLVVEQAEWRNLAFAVFEVVKD